MPIAKPTVTIGIPAYNEGKIIGDLVRALLQQDTADFVLDAVLINSDGSSDDTVEVCNALGSSKVRVLDHVERKGKAVRQTELFQLNRSDIHINFDADVMPAHRHVVSALVNEFGSQVGLVGGVPVPLRSTGVVERLATAETDIWHKALKLANAGDSIYQHEGRVSAIRGDAAAAIEIPAGISGTDDFVYLAVKRQGREFRIAQDAVVYFKPPQTLRDWLKQRRRFLASPRVQASFFGANVRREFRVPKRYVLRAAADSGLRSPLLTSCCVAIWLLGRVETRLGSFKRHPFGWDVSRSTKALVS